MSFTAYIEEVSKCGNISFLYSRRIQFVSLLGYWILSLNFSVVHLILSRLNSTLAGACIKLNLVRFPQHSCQFIIYKSSYDSTSHILRQCIVWTPECQKHMLSTVFEQWTQAYVTLNFINDFLPCPVLQFCRKMLQSEGMCLCTNTSHEAVLFILLCLFTSSI